MIYIRSTYANFNTNEYLTRTTACKWKFLAPDGYGFKVVIEIFNVSATTKFSIINSTQIILNERSVKLLHPYYNSDMFIQIDLSKSDPNFVTQVEFQAYVTIVKQQFGMSIPSCISTEIDVGTRWTNLISPLQGYDNNMCCSYNFTILKNRGVSVYIEQLWLETNVDVLKYRIGDSANVLIVDYEDIVIQPKNIDREAVFEFISDGSIHGLGFSLVFIMEGILFVYSCGI
uniref:CUB domain-containing protein n=1 Tax=Panagrolaimus superbus TaxID=310955 RepID=A0A914XXC1_9BILA